MSGFKNFWNFKTILDKEETAIDDFESKSSAVRMNVPFLSNVQTANTAFYPAGEKDVPHQSGSPDARDHSFDDDLKNLQQLTITQLHELRRTIALHCHPDLKYRTGLNRNDDLMSKANGLIDDEIKHRSTDDSGP